MKKGLSGFSLRSKLLIVLTTVPVLVLGLYLLMATQLFERDKIAYVYDSSVSLSQAISTQVRIEVEVITEKVKFYLENFDSEKNKYSDASRAGFNSQEHIIALVVQKVKSNANQNSVAMFKQREGRDLFLQSSSVIREVRQKLQSSEVAIRVVSQTGKHLIVGYHIAIGAEKEMAFVTAIVNAERLISTVISSKVFNHMIVTTAGETVVGRETLTNLGIDAETFSMIASPVVQKQSHRGTKEVTASNSKSYLISFNDLGLGDLIMLSVVRKDLALEAVNLLIAKSLVFFIALVCITIIISLFASVKLTSTLRELVEASNLMAKGQFTKRVQKRSDDEIGSLAESFNVMATEVSRLLEETADKAKLESELATVQTVQETLFPEENVSFGPITISGHYEPASGCGGDWWSYSVIDDKVWLWIGDATGHGASAALITSAAKAVSSVLETLPNIAPGSAMEILNQAIYDTSKGKMMMTFFIGAIDLTTGELTYASASHDPPYLIAQNFGEEIKKSHLVPLNEVNGLRLGEQRKSKFEEARLQLNGTESIFFYTDGVSDVRNRKGEAIGERGFLKVLVNAANSDASPSERVNFLKATLSEFRDGSELPDDITFFMMNYRKSA